MTYRPAITIKEFNAKANKKNILMYALLAWTYKQYFNLIPTLFLWKIVLMRYET